MSTQTLSRQRSSSNQPLPRALRRGLAVLTGVLGLLVMLGGLQLFTAGIAHYQASAFIAHWEKQRSQPSEQAWQVAADAINRAIKYHPAANGTYLEKRGYIYQWQYADAALDEPTALASRHAAVQAQRDATQARPTWPDAWAALAYAKLSVLEFDDEFTHALQQAQHFGPWRIGINRRIAEIGLTALAVLNTDQTAVIFTAAQRTAQYSVNERKWLFALAQETKHLAALCQALTHPYPECAALSKPETPQHE